MKARVLIVDDHPSYVARLRAAAQARGFQVLEPCENANDAVRLCSDLRPEIVVIDLHLSGEMEGLALAQVLHDLLPQTVIVGEDAFSNLEEMEEAFASGVHRCLRKPFRMEEALRLFENLAAERDEIAS